MFKINLLDVNVVEAQKCCNYFDQGYVYTEEIYPELFNNPHAKITMVGKQISVYYKIQQKKII